MALPVPLTIKPMEAEAVAALPDGKGWLYEPKYDGFRCLAFRDGAEIHLQSKNQKSLERYFPELAKGLADLAADRFVLDGEIVLPGEAFEALQLRLHPARSRIEKLAAEHPAALIAFDLLVDAGGKDLTHEPFSRRRDALQDLIAREGELPFLRLSKATASKAAAKRWLGSEGLDGIVAKRLDLPYQPGARAMPKFMLWKAVDCVVGGLYRQERTGDVGL